MEADENDSLAVKNLVASSSKSKRTVFSGIQPTGIPHLGNYLGALRQWVTLQDTADSATTLIYSLVDLHAITIGQDPARLRRWRSESLAILLAIGLDPSRSIIFHQSSVPAHAQLHWILSCHASTGYLQRMTQWKDKTSSSTSACGAQPDQRKLGLFSYPVLQAADVLVHAATHVPVGHDQAQHLEFTRDLAQGFNAAVGSPVLLPPQILLGTARRIMSLTQPAQKMSKSASNSRSRILLTDSPEELRAKVRAAVTDSEYAFSYDPTGRPGVSNLFDILFHCTVPDGNEAERQTLVADLNGVTMPAFKDRVLQGVKAVVAPIKDRYEAIVSDERLLKATATEGRDKAKLNAQRVLGKVSKTVGLA